MVLRYKHDFMIEVRALGLSKITSDVKLPTKLFQRNDERNMA